MRLSPRPSISWNTEIDKLCNRRKAIHLPSWILWTLWSTSMVQPDDGYQLWTLIKKKKAITYPDDRLLQSQTKAETFTLIHEYHQLKAAPDKTNFFRRKIKFLGLVISKKGIQPVAKKVKDLQNPNFPESKRDVMKVLGCLCFYSCYIKNLHVDSQLFYELIKDTTPFKRTDQHEELFEEINTRISEDTILSTPSTPSTYTSTPLMSEPAAY